MTRWCIPLLLIVGLVMLPACEQTPETPESDAGPAPDTTAGDTAAPAATPAAPPFDLPEVDTTRLPFPIQTKIGAARTVLRSTPDSVQALTELGALYLVHGHPQAAVACFEQLARLKPDQFVPWYFLALAHEEIGNEAQAIANIEKALQVQEDDHARNPEAPQTYNPGRMRLAALLEDDDPDRAAKLYQRVLEDRPDMAAAHLGLGRTYHALGKHEQAVEHYRVALNDVPGFGPLHTELAESLEALGRDDEAALHHAQATETEAVRDYEDQLRDMMLRAGCEIDAVLRSVSAAISQRQYDQAEQLVNLLREIAPEDARTLNAMGMLQAARDDYGTAAQLFQSAVGLDDTLTAAKYNLATALMALGQMPDAERVLLDILQTEPTHTSALTRYCALARQAGTPRAATPVLQAALKAAPTEAMVHYDVGRLYLEFVGDTTQGIENLRRAIDLFPDFVQARTMLGMALHQVGDTAGARREWERVIELDPTVVPAQGALAEVMLQAKEYRQLEEHLRNALEALPNSPALANALAWLLATSPIAEQRNAEEAVRLAEQACKQTNYNDTGLLDTLAAAYAEAGRFEEAQQQIKQAMALARSAEPTDERQRAELRGALEKYRNRLELYEAEKPYRLEE